MFVVKALLGPLSALLKDNLDVKLGLNHLLLHIPFRTGGNSINTTLSTLYDEKD